MAKIFDPEFIVLWYSKFSAMKKLLFLISLCFLNHSFAQPFLPMLDNDHRWSVDVVYCPFGGPPPFSFTTTYQLSIIGEEIVNGKTYKIIESTPGIITGCLVREENGIVFKYNPTINDEEVLYDFNLEVGDTFTMLDSPSCTLGDSTPGLGAQLTVTNTFSNMIAGELRKVIEFSTAPYGEEYWIEGIGSITGFEPYVEVLDSTCWSKLACFTIDGAIYYFNNATACDNTTLNLPEYLRDEMVLAPNPVTDVSILQLPSELNIDTIRILDITGKVISEETITKNYMTISAMDYAAGVYFYQALSENNVIKTERFVIR